MSILRYYVGLGEKYKRIRNYFKIFFSVKEIKILPKLNLVDQVILRSFPQIISLFFQSESAKSTKISSRIVGFQSFNKFNDANCSNIFEF